MLVSCWTSAEEMLERCWGSTGEVLEGLRLLVRVLVMCWGGAGDVLEVLERDASEGSCMKY